MRIDLVLTVAQSKRLIAKGIAQYEPVRQALAEGTVAVAKGGTNAYVVEELLGEPIDKHHYVTGQVLPRGVSRGDVDFTSDLPDLVLVRGERQEGTSATDAAANMQAGDVFLKGANALNYEAAVAGLLIGHPTGGTIAQALGTLIARKIRLLVPVGLEKEVPFDIVGVAGMLGEEGGGGPSLWPLHGDLFTEVEALDVLCGVMAVPIAAGGVAGAEGAVWLACFGTEEQLDQVKTLREGLADEPPFAAGR
ncbi:MAG: hypothetical protein ACODAJ_08995 [Planctomycetota bacterium]